MFDVDKIMCIHATARTTEVRKCKTAIGEVRQKTREFTSQAEGGIN
jgi:hypothetical protein